MISLLSFQFAIKYEYNFIISSFLLGKFTNKNTIRKMKQQFLMTYRKTKLSHNPSFDLDFIASSVHTQPSMKNLKHLSLPKIGQRIYENMFKEICQSVRVSKNKQDLSTAYKSNSSRNIKYKKKMDQQQIYFKRKAIIPKQMQQIVNVKKYGRWF